MNNQITPERLANLAKAMDKVAKISGENVVMPGFSSTYMVPIDIVYQPQDDWNQCGEVLEELYKDPRVLEVSYQYDPKHNEHFCDITLIEGGYYRGISKSNPTEATVLAALEFMESKE